MLRCWASQLAAASRVLTWRLCQVTSCHVNHGCLRKTCLHVSRFSHRTALWQQDRAAQSLPAEVANSQQDEIEYLEKFLKTLNVEKIPMESRQKYIDLVEKVMKEKEAKQDLESLAPDKKKLLTVLQLEYDAWLSLGYRVPRSILPSQWKVLLICQHESARKKQYTLWEAKEQAITSKKITGIKRRARKAYRKAVLERETQQAKQGGFLPDHLLTRYIMSIRDNAVTNFHLHKTAFAMVNHQDLVIDCSFEHESTDREIKELYVQIQFAYGAMKLTREPLHLVLTGLEPGSRLDTIMRSEWQGLDRALLTISSQQVEELYPLDKLVILSPNAGKMMEEYDYDKTYVIGGLVDISGQRPLTLAKAKRLGISCQKVPLDKYIQWEEGNKAFPINHMALMMQCMYQTRRDWRRALRVLPKHKIRYWR